MTFDLTTVFHLLGALMMAAVTTAIPILVPRSPEAPRRRQRH